MFLVTNIVFILLIIRLSLDSKVLKSVMRYRWSSLLRFQHIFFFMSFTVITALTGSSFLDPPQLILYVIFVVLANLGIYALVYSYLVPEYYLSNKYPAFILYALVVFLVSSLFLILMEPTLFQINFDARFTHANFLYLVYSLQAFVILIASFLGITKDKFLIEQDYKELGEEKDQIHLDLMKSKLSPHFLLNTLNNIYVKSFEPTGQTSDSILQLSKLLQYVIYDSSAEKIVVSKEFSMMKSLHGLYKLKYSNALDITFDIQQEETLDLIEIPPAIFLTMFENALKHSAIGLDKASFIRIRYKIEDHMLFFEIHNYAPQRPISVETGYEGLGNKAIIHILEKFYAGRFTFTAQLVESTVYRAVLKIEL